MILTLAICATAAAFVGPAATPQKTTALQHHKVRSQVADLKIYREEIDWETGEVVKREVEETVEDLVAKQPVKLKYTYEERRGEEGQKLALPPVFGGVGAAIAVAAIAAQEPVAGLFATPAVLGAAAFAFNELKPVPVTYVGNEDRLKAQFEKHASTNMKLLLEDVTAHRYFEGIHLEPALKELGLAGLGPDPPSLIEAELSGGGAEDTDEVTLSLIFYSPECPYKLWAALDRKGTLDAFFACNAEVEKISQHEKKLAVRLSVLKPAQTPAVALPIGSASTVSVEASAAPVEGAVAR